MAKAYRPTVTQAEFDTASPALRRSLKEWYDDLKDDPAAPASNPKTAGAFEHLPDIDSKAVVTASPIIKKHIGADLDPKLIRKGGYTSFGELIGDLLPRLRGTCPKVVTKVLTKKGGTP